jgi:hypothetical protein
MVTRLGLYGGPRGLYGDFSGKAAAAVQMSGSTGWQTAPTGALDVEATLAGSTGWATTPTGSADVLATLVGGTGWTWTPSGNIPGAEDETEQPTGGFGAANYYGAYLQRKRRREEERREVMTEVAELEPTDREIARILQKDLQYEARTQQIEELDQLIQQADINLQRNEFKKNKNLEKAFVKAYMERSFSALESFERQLERQLEEEDFLLLIMTVM